MPSLTMGDRAPDFTLPSQTGESVSLAMFRGKQTVVLYFYPKDGTPACTKEACSFRDAYDEFIEAGAAVVGVSSDATHKHRDFATKNRLPFLLVSDSDGSLRRAFGVPKTLGFLPGRVTYVIDKEGIIRHMFNSQTSVARHVSEAMGVVRELAEEPRDKPPTS